MNSREILVTSVVVLIGLGIGIGLQNVSFSLDSFTSPTNSTFNAKVLSEDPDLSSFTSYADRISKEAVLPSEVPLETFDNRYGPWAGSPVKYLPARMLSSREKGAVVAFPSGTALNPGDGNIVQVMSLPKNKDMSVIMKGRHAKDILNVRTTCDTYNTTGFVSVMQWNNSALENPLQGSGEDLLSSTQANKTKTFTTNSSRLVMQIPDRFEGKNIAFFGGVTPKSTRCGFWPSKAIEIERLYVGVVQ